MTPRSMSTSSRRPEPAASRGMSHIIGVDDAPFAREHRGNVRIVGCAFAGTRLECVLSGAVRRDGANATRVIGQLIEQSKFYEHLHLVMLQGVAVAGFNVVDVAELHRRLGRPVLVIARRAPDLAAIRQSLFQRVRGGARKWALIQALGPMEPLADVFVQRCGLAPAEAERVIRATAVHSRIPEPLRCAHLIAGGVTTGQSGRRV